METIICISSILAFICSSVPRPELPTYTCLISEPNKEKTESHHHNGDLSSSNVVNRSPKSCGSLMSPGSGGPPPGSVALPGLVTHRENGVSVTVTNGAGSYHGNRTVYSPESDHSPPTPGPPPPQRPASLGAVKGQPAGKSGGKRTRWLLCYHMGSGPPSASPSPPSEQGTSQNSTPSPTDHGFKLPNSFSNERPTSLPVALLNCSGSANTDSLSSVVGRGLGGESNITTGSCMIYQIFLVLFHINHFAPLLSACTLSFPTVSLITIGNFSREGSTKILLNVKLYCLSFLLDNYPETFLDSFTLSSF